MENGQARPVIRRQAYNSMIKAAKTYLHATKVNIADTLYQQLLDQWTVDLSDTYRAWSISKPAIVLEKSAKMCKSTNTTLRDMMPASNSKSG